MKKRIITISRQFGSGGHSIAKTAAERMGIAFYDNQLITEVARRSGLSEEFIRENEEYASHSNSFLYQLAMSTAGTYGYPSVYQKLYEAQTKVIPMFNLEVPTSLPGVNPAILDPRDTYADASEWETKAKDLAARFIKNFVKYTGNDAGKALVAAGPQL